LDQSFVKLAKIHVGEAQEFAGRLQNNQDFFRPIAAVNTDDKSTALGAKRNAQMRKRIFACQIRRRWNQLLGEQDALRLRVHKMDASGAISDNQKRRIAIEGDFLGRVICRVTRRTRAKGRSEMERGERALK
jgi:hypothetical protein